MDPPDWRDQAAYEAPHQTRQGETSTKRARVDKPVIADFYTLGRDLQNRSGHRIGSELSEDLRFRSYFGCSAEVMLRLWQMLNSFGCLPHKTQIVHLLWSCFFMKVYPSQNVACSTAGGSSGAIDPKTLRKYVWPMIRAVSDLEQYVVSKCYFDFCSNKLRSLIFRSFLRTGLKTTNTMTAL